MPLSPPGSLLATDRSKAVVWVKFLLNIFAVGVSCRILYSFVVNLYLRGAIKKFVDKLNIFFIYHCI